MATHTFLDKKSVFSSVYSENWKALYAFAFSIIKDKEAAEDIVQEIYLDFWARMEDTEITYYKSYLFQAARNQCAKRLKDKKLTVLEVEILDQAFQLVEEEYSEIAKDAIVQEVQRKAEEILPYKCLDIFKLRFYENLSIKEIASRKDISISTVENQINKALKLLKEQNIHYFKLLAVLIATSHFK